MTGPMTAPDSALPIRDGSRDGSALPPLPNQPNQAPQPRSCPVCATPLTSARARYCSAACKQHAFRLRHQAPLAPADDVRVRDDLRRHGSLVAHTLYECPRCGERLLGERRCPECHVFCRALGLGGQCPECEQPILLAELLGTEVVMH